MPKLSMQVPHALGRDEAIRRVKEKLELARDKVSDLHDQWQDNILSFDFIAMGMKVKGTLTLEDAAANVDVNLPITAMMFKGMIEQRVREELGKGLA